MTDVEQEMLDALFTAVRDFQYQTGKNVKTIRVHPQDWHMIARTEWARTHLEYGHRSFPTLMGFFFEVTPEIRQGEARLLDESMLVVGSTVIRRPRTLWQRLIGEHL